MHRIFPTPKCSPYITGRRVPCYSSFLPSVIYQDILQKGEQKGRQEGEMILILRQITRRFGTVPLSVETQIRSLPLPQLEDLGEALFDFSEVADLEDWLRSHS